MTYSKNEVVSGGEHISLLTVLHSRLPTSFRGFLTDLFSLHNGTNMRLAGCPGMACSPNV